MDKIAKFKQIICDSVFVLNKNEPLGAQEDPNAWIFDFRRILMNGKNADLVSEIFYEKFKERLPFQLCTIEVAGIPLVTSLMTKFFYKGHENINAFFIRKSRKKDGLMRMIEGEIQEEKRIVLVDDIINSGNSFWRQIEVLEGLGYKIDTIWSILRFRDIAYYKRFTEKGIRVESLFTLDDFHVCLNGRVQNLVDKNETPVPMPFKVEWTFKSTNPSYGYVISKSQPVLDETKIYFGSDNRIFWALNQNDGSVAWKYQVGPSRNKKSIFSNPIIFKDLVIFGSYDGNIYALNKETGERVWVAFEADWIGSSPAIAYDLGVVFIGLEFGLIKKRGGVAALDARTGKTLWVDVSHFGFTHASPLYIQKHKQVAIGSNDGKVRLYDAKKGTLLWEFVTDGGRDYSPLRDGGFGKGDIKEGSAYDQKRDLLIFGSIDGNLYILKRKSGTFVHKHKCGFGIFSTPLIYENRVYFTSTDKRLRCINLDNFNIIFERNVDDTRIFSSPIVVNDKLYVGTNAGRLHEIDLHTGKELGYFQTAERITNSVVHNTKTNTFFLPTYANEVFCLKKYLRNLNK